MLFFPEVIFSWQDSAVGVIIKKYTEHFLQCMVTVAEGGKMRRLSGLLLSCLLICGSCQMAAADDFSPEYPDSTEVLYQSGSAAEQDAGGFSGEDASGLVFSANQGEDAGFAGEEEAYGEPAYGEGTPEGASEDPFAGEVPSGDSGAEGGYLNDDSGITDDPSGDFAAGTSSPEEFTQDASSPEDGSADESSVDASSAEELYDEEPAEEDWAQFSSGYVLVKKDTAVYSDPAGPEANGFFTEDSVVYAMSVPVPEDPDTVWLRVLFDTEEARQEEREAGELFIRAEGVAFLTEEEEEQVINNLASEPDVRMSGEILLPLAGYASVMEKDEAAETDLPAAAQTKSQKVSDKAANASSSGITITRQPSNVTASVGSTVTFSVTASGTGLTYQWLYWNQSTSSWKVSGLSGSSTRTVRVPVTAQRAGLYYCCRIKDSYGNIRYSDYARLNVRLAITSQPSSASGLCGHTVQFSISAAGNQLTYCWQYRAPGSSYWSNSGIETSRSKVFKVPVISARNRMSYRCVVRDEFGNQVISNTVTLTVGLKIVKHPSSVTVSAGKSAGFSVSVSGAGLKYQWQWRAGSSGSWANTRLSGYNTHYLRFTASAGFNKRQYRCVVTDANGARAYSNAATLTVNSAAGISIRSDVYSDARMTYTQLRSKYGSYAYQLHGLHWYMDLPGKNYSVAFMASGWNDSTSMPYVKGTDSVWHAGGYVSDLLNFSYSSISWSDFVNLIGKKYYVTSYRVVSNPPTGYYLGENCGEVYFTDNATGQRWKLTVSRDSSTAVTKYTSCWLGMN